MKKVFYIFLILGVLFSFTSCFHRVSKKIATVTIKGDGKIISHKVEFSTPVVSVENSTFGDVKYECSDGKSWLEIKTDSNILEYILAEVNEKGELSIYQKPEVKNPTCSNAKITFLKPHKLFYIIHSPSLERVLITGGGKFYANGKDGSSPLKPEAKFLLRVWGEGSASISFIGQCSSMSISAEHRANITLRKISTEFLEVRNRGEGTIKLQGNALRAELNNESSGKIDTSKLKIY